jgi:glycine cleavage system aminomethyltransferase T
MDRSPLLSRHEAAGARLAARPEAPDHVAPLLFAGVPEEYRAGREGCALLDTSDRGRVTVTGADATDFLHRLLANRVKPLAAGDGGANLLLTPKGKVQFAFDVTRTAEGYELSTPPGGAAGLRAALDRYLFAEKLELVDTSAEHAPLELLGPHAPEVLATVLGEPAALEPGHWRDAAWKGLSLRVHALARGWRVDGAGARLAELWEALVAAGATPVGLAARDCLRIEERSALYGVDVDENVYPQEAGLEHASSRYRTRPAVYSSAAATQTFRQTRRRSPSEIASARKTAVRYA